MEYDYNYIIDIPYRAFFNGVSCPEDNCIQVTYTANHSAEQGFWEEVFSASEYIESIEIIVNSEYPEDEEEMGKDFKIVIK